MAEVVEATFSVQMLDGELLAEAAFGDAVDAVTDALRQSEQPFGELVLRGGGQPEIVLPDDLIPLADAVLAGVAALQAGDTAVIAAFSQPFALRATREGGDIVIRDTSGQQRRDPAEPLLAALTGCAKRIVARLEAASKGTSWGAAVKPLARKAAAAA